MNRRKAKQLLEVYRVNEMDASDPQFVEALQHAQSDPKLAQWFADQRRFDRIVSDSLRALTVPGDLKAGILEDRKVVRPPFWQTWRFRAAAAACLVALATVIALVTANPTAQFPNLRSSLVDKAWSAEGRHLEFESSDIARVKQWLARRFVSTDVHLPAGLQGAKLVGCRVVETDGLRVPMLCLADGSKHLHLFVVDGVTLTDAPERRAPDFEKCSGWKTAAWRQGGQTYVLTGMDYQTFVNRFRKSGRWTTSG